jgi:hypothetical protein
MDFDRVRSELVANAQRIAALVQGVSDEQARWKPDPETWSILEVMHHLLDEEREDFRVRLDYTLHRPGEPWPPIDPGGWVSSRRYNEQELEATVEAYLAERQDSLAWLDGLDAPDWETSREAPWGEPIAAGDLFAAWLAHDLLHMRQVVELHWVWAGDAVAPYRVLYAGEW